MNKNCQTTNEAHTLCALMLLEGVLKGRGEGTYNDGEISLIEVDHVEVVLSEGNRFSHDSYRFFGMSLYF